MYGIVSKNNQTIYLKLFNIIVASSPVFFTVDKLVPPQSGQLVEYFWTEFTR